LELTDLLRRDRWLTIGGLALVVAVTSVYLLRGAGMDTSALDMTRMARDMRMPQPEWTLRYAALMFAMWWLMMTAMMLPSATPVLLLVAALNRRASPGRPPYGATALFAAGYLLAWAGFSLAAVAAQAWLTAQGSLSSMLHVGGGALAAGMLLAAGLWQLTALKRACLRHCRSPVHFLAAHRRRGALGALVMGAEHGVYCVGCCWMMMALLFVGGIMNLYWIAGLAGYALAEKLMPGGERVARVTGTILIAGGITLLASAALRA
jgi:predicted metal-binding membrane protein